MAVGKEPDGYRFARLLRERGWQTIERDGFFDCGFSYGYALMVVDGGRNRLWARAVRHKISRTRTPIPLTLKLMLRTTLHREFLDHISRT